MWFVSLLVLIFMLGIIILVHELGHFLWAKKFGVHIYEFSIGMGPVIHTFKGKKDGIDYNIRAIPIGGFVAMAGEVGEDDEELKKDDFLCNKKWWQRLIILAAGVINNFIMAIVLLIVCSLIWGGRSMTNEISFIGENTPIEEAGLKVGDKILAIDGHKFSSWDVMQIRLMMKSKDGYHTFTVENEKGKKDYKIKPDMVKQDDGEKYPVYGFSPTEKLHKGFGPAIKFAFQKFGDTISSMLVTLGGLLTGKLSIKYLSGPVGIYEAVDVMISVGIEQVLSLFILLSINVGVINILPFPAFDGGHILFLLIEKIKGSPVNPKVEGVINAIGLVMLFILMAIITLKDIIHLF